jgi:hypothetical protein
MKYIIKESQIKNMMWNYLDSPNYIVLGGEHVGEIVLLREGTENHHDYLYTFDDKRLLVGEDIVFGVSSLFNIDPEDSLDYIGEWFEDRYNLEVHEIINWFD